MFRSIIYFLLAALIISSSPAHSQFEGSQHTFLPFGGGYMDLYHQITAAVIDKTDNSSVNILLFPVNLASNSTNISNRERIEHLNSAELQRVKFEEACISQIPPEYTCLIEIVPILSWQDANNPEYLENFTSDLDAIVFLDGSPSIGLMAIGGTPVELALSQAYEDGVILSGTGAGSILLSNPAIVGYNAEYDALNALDFGAPDVWGTAEKRALLFGIKNSIIEDHFYLKGNFSRLLNAIATSEQSKLGLGFDDATGGFIRNETTLNDVFGSSVVTILDAATYHSDQAVNYRGPDNTLSLRNILVHTLAPSNYSFDLVRRKHDLRFPYLRLERSLESFTLPPGSGPLIVAGDLSDNLEDNEVLNRFLRLSGGNSAKILIAAGGHASPSESEKIAAEYASSLQGDTVITVIHESDLVFSESIDDYTGIIMILGDPALVQFEVFRTIQDAWESGKPILMDRNAAAAVGMYYSSPKYPQPTINDDGVLVGSRPIQNSTSINSGSGFLEVNFVPRIMVDNRWGELISLAYNHPNLLSLGLNQNSAIEFNYSGARVLGKGPVIVLDLRSATLDMGENNGYIIANGVLDIFSYGEKIDFETADVNLVPNRMPTPELYTPTFTPLPTQTSPPTQTPTVTSTPTISPTPTKRVKPTSTPLIIPPPSDPITRNMMVTFGVLIVLVVIIGVLVNRRRIF